MVRSKTPQHIVPLALLLLFSGCGTNRPETVPVRGTITFDGQVPPAEGALFFAPVDVPGGLPRRPGRAFFDDSGSFAATSFEDADGLVPGEYVVRIECWRRLPTMTDSGESYVAHGHQVPNLVVKSGDSPRQLDINVPAANY